MGRLRLAAYLTKSGPMDFVADEVRRDDLVGRRALMEAMIEVGRIVGQFAGRVGLMEGFVPSGVIGAGMGNTGRPETRDGAEAGDCSSARTVYPTISATALA
jgi:hypothetical protein